MAHLTYLRSLISGFLVGLLIFLFVVAFQLGSPTDYALSVEGMYQNKSDIVESIPSPKLVIIAGSNSRLGISCEMIYQETKTNCFNGGTLITVETEYILYRAKQWLNKGDIVLLPLEYRFYRGNGEANTVLIDYVLSQDPKFLLSANWLTKIRIITGISWERLQKGITTKFKPNTQSENTVDSSEYSNQYGDDITNLESKMTKKLKEEIAALKPQEPFVYKNTTFGMKRIEEFVKYCRQNNIQVLATWPNTIWFEIYKQTRTDEFNKIREFYKSINVDVLGNPEDSMYDKSMFYDSIYHLHDRGVKVRTKQLIKLLRPYLDKMKQDRGN